MIDRKSGLLYTLKLKVQHFVSIAARHRICVWRNVARYTCMLLSIDVKDKQTSKEQTSKRVASTVEITY
jgi:hypothetical protein